MRPVEHLHPDSEKLEDLARGRLPRPQAAEVVRHLLTGCPRCLRVTRRLWAVAERSPRGLLVLVEGGRGRNAAAAARR